MSEAITKALQDVIAAHDHSLAIIGEQMRDADITALTIGGPDGEAALMMFEAISAARAALSQPAPAPHPAVPVVSDEQIDAATRHLYHNGRPTTKEYRVGIANTILALRPAVEPMTDDTARLDYLQERGATVDLVAGIVGPTPMRFRIGGLHTAVNSDIRKAIDAARGITAKAEGIV